MAEDIVRRMQIESELILLEAAVEKAEQAEKSAKQAADEAREALQAELRQAADQGFNLARWNHEVVMRNSRTTVHTR
jgi:hypothetical protein